MHTITSTDCTPITERKNAKLGVEEKKNAKKSMKNTSKDCTRAVEKKNAIWEEQHEHLSIRVAR